jgi:hypothetical protein
VQHLPGHDEVGGDDDGDVEGLDPTRFDPQPATEDESGPILGDFVEDELPAPVDASAVGLFPMRRQVLA